MASIEKLPSKSSHENLKRRVGDDSSDEDDDNWRLLTQQELS